MASFRAQCSIEVYGADYGDFRGLISAEQYRQGWVGEVHCEDCGNCIVDHHGRCIGGCIKGHGTALGGAPGDKTAHEPKTEREA